MRLAVADEVEVTLLKGEVIGDATYDDRHAQRPQSQGTAWLRSVCRS